MRIEIVLIIISMALVTFMTRIGSVALFRMTGVPNWLGRWLKHIPVAILSALIVPSLLLPKGYLDISANNHYLLAGIVSTFVAYKTRNIIPTLGLGMSVMFFLKVVN